jgi:hypothetical protein
MVRSSIAKGNRASNHSNHAPSALHLRRPQTIADPGFGEEVLRPLRIGLDLLTKLADVDAEILRVIIVIRISQLLS